jgi:hypothetical protein
MKQEGWPLGMLLLGYGRKKYFGDENTKIYIYVHSLNSVRCVVSLSYISGKEAIILKEIYCVHSKHTIISMLLGTELAGSSSLSLSVGSKHVAESIIYLVQR